MRFIVSCYFWVIVAIYLVIGIPLLLLAIALLPRPIAYQCGRFFSWSGLGLLGIRVRVRGSEKLDRRRADIFMSNHVNLLDPFVLAIAVPIASVGIEKRENFKIPFYGWLMRRWGNLPIDRTDLERAKRDLAAAAEFARRGGAWLAVFPEGTRTRTGLLGPFKKGGFHLALDTGAPIVPVTMNGAWDVLRTGQWWARPGVVEVIYGDPIDPADYGRERLDDLMDAVRQGILAPFKPQVLDHADEPSLKPRKSNS